MFTMDERRAVEQVCSRLTERFPEVPLQTVQLTVQDVHHKFDGRVRDYVPILVEREAKSRLVAISAQTRRQQGG